MATMAISWRARVAVSALWFAALYAQISPRPPRHDTADEIPPPGANARFDCLFGLLPPGTLVSYAPAARLDTHSDDGLRSIRSFHFAQYALAPAFVTAEPGNRVILVDGIDRHPDEARGTVLGDCGDGVRLIDTSPTR
jgi:hypothetical protein